MSESLDLKKVLDRSASDVSVDELSRKGFRTVKVLNREAIQRLILEAVDRVLRDRAEEIGREERDRISAQSQAEFDRLLRERLAREQEGIDEQQERLEGLRRELEAREARLAEEARELQGRAEAFEGRRQEDRGELRSFLETILEELRSPGDRTPAQSLQEIREAIEALGRRIAAGAGPAGTGSGDSDAEALASATIALAGEEGLESNIEQVGMKEAKAGGIRGTLAKLKCLKSGGGEGAAGP